MMKGEINHENDNGSEEVLKQNVWGPTYVDEIVQIAVNQDPSNVSSTSPTGNGWCSLAGGCYAI